MITFLCSALLLLKSVGGASVKPENEVVVLHRELILPCTFPAHQLATQNYLYWRLNDGRDINNGVKIYPIFASSFGVIQENSTASVRRDLKFKNASFAQAGTYHCVPNLGDTSNGYSATVVVLDDDISCHVSAPNEMNSRDESIFVNADDSIKISCSLEFSSKELCRPEVAWRRLSDNQTLPKDAGRFFEDSSTFSLTVEADESFQNGSSYGFLVRFQCLRPRNTNTSSSREPIFFSKFVSPKFYIREKLVPEVTLAPITTTLLPVTHSPHFVPVNSHPDSTDKSSKWNVEHSTMTLTVVFASILAFFVVLVIVLVALFLTKYRKQTTADPLTAYTGGRSTMTENVAYRRQQVSCENSYNMQVNLTPPPQLPSTAFQGVMSPLIPQSSIPLLPGLQHYLQDPRLLREISTEDSEVYDKIDDKGFVPSIYMDSNKCGKQACNSLMSQRPSISSSPPPYFAPSLTGYASMNSGYNPSPVPSAAAFYTPDSGVYLIPQDNKGT